MIWFDTISPKESKEWQEVMIAYAFDVEDWRDAREKLLKLLQNEQKKADEASIRSYISCCAESISSVHPLPDLSEIVSEFYQKYGMENSNNILE